MQKLRTLIVILLLAVAVFGQSGTKAWYQVLEVKSGTSKQTDLFETKGSKWRIRWQKTDPDSSVAIYVYAKDGSPVGAILAKDNIDESYIHNHAGSFYLNISASTTYTITVEDWR